MSTTSPGPAPTAGDDRVAAAVALVSRGGPRVLVLGADGGRVATALADGADREVCLVRGATDAAAPEHADVRVVEADPQDDDLTAVLDGARFDSVVLLDVLQHLRDPGRLLEQLHDLLDDEGAVVASVPNGGHEDVVLGLATGRLPSAGRGADDAGPSRFFTRDALYGLLERHGFVVGRLTRVPGSTGSASAADDEATQQLRRRLAELSPDAGTAHFVVAATPSSEPAVLSGLRRELDEVRAELDGTADLRRERDELLAERDRVEEEYAAARERFERVVRERHSLQVELTDALAERDQADAERHVMVRAQRRLRERLDEAADAREAAEAEAAKLHKALRRVENRLDTVYDSTSFKLGWRLTAPVRAAKGGQDEPARPARVTSPDGGRRRRAPKRGEREVADGLPRETATRRAVYDAEIDRMKLSDGARGVAMLCSTTDLDAGRGDVYAATGLGIELRAHGWEAVYRAPDEWTDLPEGTEAVVSFLAEETMILDPSTVPPDVLRVAWVRNNTSRWIRNGALELYDLVLCSSQLTADELAEHYDGPIELLSLGVDPLLFDRDDSHGRDAVVSTINQWGRVRRTFRALAEVDPSVPLHLYGRATNLDERLQPHARGLVSYFEVPSLYAQAAVVLDDQQGVNAPYGNVNSRIYEALAAGALPVSGSPLGLEEAGLGELPVWRRDEELDEQLRYWTSHEAERRALVDRLRDVVLERHTFAARAERFVELIADRPRRTPPVLGFHPDYRITNPFQDMVYAGAEGRVVRPVSGPAELLTAPGLDGHRKVFHLHWIATVLNPAGDDAAEAERRAQAFLDDLDAAKAAGIGFVWTVHNVLLHESRHPELELRFRQQLADRADLIHVLSQATVAAVAEAGYELPADRTFVGDHPSYLGMYPSGISRAEARRELGLPDSAFVYLVLGQIRPYKGLERVLQAFGPIAQQHGDARLLVAGLPGKFEGVEELLLQARSTPSTTVVAEHVEDDRLQVFLRAADVVVLPHRRVLNSGLLWLAWSFGRPVVAPDTGALSDLVDDEVGVLFDADTDDLGPALLAARDLGPAHGRAAFARAEQLRPRAVSRELLAAIDAAVPDRS